MEGFDIILHNILLLAAAMAVGFTAVKTGYVSVEVKNALSKIIVRITLPLLILNALTGIELTAGRLKNAGLVLLIALVSIGVLYCIGIFTSRLFRLPKATAVIHRCMMGFGNVAFLGYPLIRALFGDEGFFYAAVYQFVNDVFVWTFVVCQLNALGKNEKITVRETVKNIINPCTVSFFISFVMMLFGVKFTGFAHEITNGIGGMTTYLSMLFIGGTLAEVKLSEIKRIGSIFLIILIKMLIMPTILIIVTKYLPLSEAARGAAILQVAVPSQTIISVLTLEYGGDTVYTSEGILITTLAGLATMPIVYWLMSSVLI